MKTLFVLIWLLMLTIHSNLLAHNYQFVKEKDNIKLFERWITNNKNEKIRELKVTYSINANISAIIQLLKHPNKGKVWNKKASIYKTQEISNNTFLTYFFYDMPLMLDDQDCLLLYYFPNFLGSEKNYEISFKSHHSNLFPTKKNTKRITGVNGKWQLQQENKGVTQISYTISSDKSANIPKSISDPIVYENILQSMISFKNLLEI